MKRLLLFAIITLFYSTNVFGNEIFLEVEKRNFIQFNFKTLEEASKFRNEVVNFTYVELLNYARENNIVFNKFDKIQKDEVLKELVEKIFSAKRNQISEVIETSLGKHVIFVSYIFPEKKYDDPVNIAHIEKLNDYLINLKLKAACNYNLKLLEDSIKLPGYLVQQVDIFCLLLRNKINEANLLYSLYKEQDYQKNYFSVMYELIKDTKSKNLRREVFSDLEWTWINKPEKEFNKNSPNFNYYLPLYAAMAHATQNYNYFHKDWFEDYQKNINLCTSVIYNNHIIHNLDLKFEALNCYNKNSPLNTDQFEILRDKLLYSVNIDIDQPYQPIQKCNEPKRDERCYAIEHWSANNEKKSLIYIGSFENKKKNGLGKLYMVNNYNCINNFFDECIIDYSSPFYYAEFEDNVVLKSLMSFNDQNEVYVVPYKNRRPHGQGKWFKNSSKNAQMYKGDWVDGAVGKNGTIYYQSGKIYSGELLNGKPHGMGKIMLANGNTAEEGEWEKGVLKVVENKSIKQVSPNQLFTKPAF